MNRLMRIVFADDAPRLSILTVAFRPRGLWSLHDKLLRQSDKSFEHILAMDEIPTGSGFEWCGRMWAAAGMEACGDYLAVMNDDEEPVDDDAVRRLTESLRLHEYPDILIVGLDFAMRSGARTILPNGESREQKRFVRGQISPQCLIVRRDIWQRHARLWTEPTDDGYSIDLAFMDALLSPTLAYRVVWTEDVFCRMVSRGLGVPEVDYGQ